MTTTLEALQRLHDWAQAQSPETFFGGDHPIAVAREAIRTATSPVPDGQASAGQEGVTDERLAMVARDGYDKYWRETSRGTDSQAWAAAAKAVLALSPAAPESGWISAKERMPPCDGEPIFIGENDAGYIACFILEPGTTVKSTVPEKKEA